MKSPKFSLMNRTELLLITPGISSFPGIGFIPSLGWPGYKFIFNSFGFDLVKLSKNIDCSPECKVWTP